MYQRERIDIYHKPGRFVYEVWDENGFPLYVGGTENINAKSFKFAFPYAKLTGYYYPDDWPDFLEEIDRRIAELKPLYNTTLRASYTLPMVIKRIKERLRQAKIHFPKQGEKLIIKLFADNEQKIEFRGQLYVGYFDVVDIFSVFVQTFGITIQW